MNPYYRIKRKIEDAYWDFRKRCQRFKQGYSWEDVWNMDIWFMDTVKPMLIHLKDNGATYPMEFNNRDEWCAVLDEMISCLELMDEINVIHSLGFVEDNFWERMTNKDHDNVDEIMNNNKNRFFELFSKYFYALWD